MKVIFLDIDGVLNNADTYKRSDLSISCIDDFRVEYLKRIVDETGAKIVLTSANKVHFKKYNGKVVPSRESSIYAPDFIKILTKHGLTLYDVIPTIRDSLGKEVLRQEEIKMWLSLNDDIESFIILDDSTTELMDFVVPNFIILNNIPIGEMLYDMRNSIGLGEEHVELAINILNGKVRNKVFMKSKTSKTY